jgi:hypothetical protein
MTVMEALKSAQFVVDNSGRQTAVLLEIDAWEALIEWVEDVADTRLATQALAELEMAGGRPEKAGWLDWNDVREV